MTDSNAHFIGKVPHFYEKGLVPVIFSDYARDLTRRAVKARPESVLELAAGTGVVSRMLRSNLAADCEIIASDLNTPMLDIAKTKFAADERIVFKEIDAMDIPLPAESLDLVVCQFGVMFFPDKVASYKEAGRVLKPGGRYLFNTWGSHSENPFAAICQALVEELYPEEPPQFYNVPFHYHDPKQIKHDLTAAGFSRVKIKRQRLRKKILNLDDFVHGIVFGNPLAEQILESDRDPSEVIDLLKSAYQKAFKGSPPRMPLCAYFISGET